MKSKQKALNILATLFNVEPAGVPDNLQYDTIQLQIKVIFKTESCKASTPLNKLSLNSTNPNLENQMQIASSPHISPRQREAGPAII